MFFILKKKEFSALCSSSREGKSPIFLYLFYASINLLLPHKRIHTVLLKKLIKQQVENNRSNIATAWNGAYFPSSLITFYCKKLHKQILHFENGFFAGTWQADKKGIDENNSVPREPSFYLSLHSELVKLPLPSYNLTPSFLSMHKSHQQEIPIHG